MALPKVRILISTSVKRIHQETGCIPFHARGSSASSLILLLRLSCMYATPAQSPRISRMLVNTIVPSVQATSRKAFKIHKKARISTPFTENPTSFVEIETGKIDRTAFLALLEIFLKTFSTNLSNRSKLLSSSS